MRMYAWYLVGFGAGVMGVMPDPTLKGPRYFYKDPRAVFPAPGHSSTTSNTSHFSMLAKPDMEVISMPWVILDEVVNVSALMDMTPHTRAQIQVAVDDTDPYQPVEMIIFMDKDWWSVVVNQKKILQVEHSMGFVPLRYTTMTVPGQLGGESMFEQNIGLVLA